jgi:hypothetical protein
MMTEVNDAYLEPAGFLPAENAYGMYYAFDGPCSSDWV